MHRLRSKLADEGASCLQVVDTQTGLVNCVNLLLVDAMNLCSGGLFSIY